MSEFSVRPEENAGFNEEGWIKLLAVSFELINIVMRLFSKNNRGPLIVFIIIVK